MRTELPKKWTIRNPYNKDSELIYSYFNEGLNSPLYYNSGACFNFPNFSNYKGFKKGGHTSSGPYDKSYIEITMEEFKMLVLQESPKEPNYEIY